MSKYDPLRRHLFVDRRSEIHMTFRVIEDLLGFPLPRSARAHQAWWANTEGTHSHARSWLGAGWRTSNLDLKGESVVFVSDRVFAQAASSRSGPRSTAAQPAHRINIPLDALTPGAIRLIEDRARTSGEGVAESAAAVLNEAAMQRRRDLVAEFARLSPVIGDDSTHLIREERDAR